MTEYNGEYNNVKVLYHLAITTKKKWGIFKKKKKIQNFHYIPSRYSILITRANLLQIYFFLILYIYCGLYTHIYTKEGEVRNSCVHTTRHQKLISTFIINLQYICNILPTYICIYLQQYFIIYLILNQILIVKRTIYNKYYTEMTYHKFVIYARFLPFLEEKKSPLSLSLLGSTLLSRAGNGRRRTRRATSSFKSRAISSLYNNHLVVVVRQRAKTRKKKSYVHIKSIGEKWKA